ncbi:MAG: hypothetical protein QOC81_3937 [Thermoanaerobaculia bacterium]|jgi:hypothetical protein|nr:hypothetical protein [Thermoanaerobaculia bacterium]
MKKTAVRVDDVQPEREYDFKGGVRGKYARDYYAHNRNLRILAPDLLKVFPDSDSVNEALHALVQIAGEVASVPLKRSAIPSTPKKQKKVRA